MGARPELSIVPASAGHAEALAPTMRPEDLAEVEACGFDDARHALLSSLGESVVAYAAILDGEVAALFGVAAPDKFGPGSGVVWFLTGSAFALHPRASAQFGRRAMDILFGRFETLSNFIDARYGAAIRWAKWLGFTVGEPIPFGPFGFPFHPAKIRRP